MEKEWLGQVAWAVTFALTASAGFLLLIADHETSALDLIDKVGPTLTSIVAIGAAVWAGSRAWQGVQAQIASAERHRREDARSKYEGVLSAVLYDLVNMEFFAKDYKVKSEIPSDIGTLITAMREDMFRFNAQVGAVVALHMQEFEDFKIKHARNAGYDELPLKVKASKLMYRTEAIEICVGNALEQYMAGRTVELPLIDQENLGRLLKKHNIAEENLAYVLPLAREG